MAKTRMELMVYSASPRLQPVAVARGVPPWRFFETLKESVCMVREDSEVGEPVTNMAPFILFRVILVIV